MRHGSQTVRKWEAINHQEDGTLPYRSYTGSDATAVVLSIPPALVWAVRTAAVVAFNPACGLMCQDTVWHVINAYVRAPSLRKVFLKTPTMVTTCLLGSCQDPPLKLQTHIIFAAAGEYVAAHTSRVACEVHICTCNDEHVGLGGC